MAIDVDRRALVTRAEASTMLRVSERTIDRWRKLGLLPGVQLLAGGAVRFRLDDVEALLEPEVRPAAPARESELEWQ